MAAAKAVTPSESILFLCKRSCVMFLDLIALTILVAPHAPSLLFDRFRILSEESDLIPILKSLASSSPMLL